MNLDRATRRNALGRVAALVLGAATLTALTLPPAAATPLPYGPNTCAPGYVWRDAYHGDQVCVTPGERDTAAAENRLAADRRNPDGGPYGPDTCKSGFVWREARPSDHVCVEPSRRDVTRTQNYEGAHRLADPSQLPMGEFLIGTEEHQLGGRIYVKRGRGLSPNATIHFYAVGVNQTGLRSLGTVPTDAGGNLIGSATTPLVDVRCVPGRTGKATVIAVDGRTGLAAKAGETGAFSC